MIRAVRVPASLTHLSSFSPFRVAVYSVNYRKWAIRCVEVYASGKEQQKGGDGLHASHCPHTDTTVKGWGAGAEGGGCPCGVQVCASDE